MRKVISAIVVTSLAGAAFVFFLLAAGCTLDTGSHDTIIGQSQLNGPTPVATPTPTDCVGITVKAVDTSCAATDITSPNGSTGCAAQAQFNAASVPPACLNSIQTSWQAGPAAVCALSGNTSSNAVTLNGLSPGSCKVTATILDVSSQAPAVVTVH